MKLKEILKQQIPGLTEKELDSFRNLWTIRRKLDRYEFLNPKDRIDDNIYFVEHGSLKIFCELEESELIVSFGYPDTFVSNLPSLLTGQISKFNIQALKACRLIGIRKTDFYDAVNSNASVAAFWKKKTELIILDLIERQVDILTSSPTERFNRLQKRNPKLLQNIPNRYVASYLRMSPETLSRIKKS